MTPRFKIHKDGRATLSGIGYQALSWILDAATVSYHNRIQEMRKEKDDPENVAMVQDQLKIVELLKISKDEAIAATHPPSGPASKEDRLHAIRQAAIERKLIDGLFERCRPTGARLGELLIDRFKKINEELDAADKALDGHFRPLVEDAISQGDFALATDLAKKCMGCGAVSGVFLMDTIRQARLGK